MIREFLKSEDGATAIEYTLLAALIGVALIGALNALKGNINTMLTNAGTAIKG